jgi:hypothetical protein
MSKSQDDKFGDNFFSFADDNNISISEDTRESHDRKMQKALDAFVRFCSDYSLKINLAKTFLTVIRRLRNQPGNNLELKIGL